MLLTIATQCGIFFTQKYIDTEILVCTTIHNNFYVVTVKNTVYRVNKLRYKLVSVRLASTYNYLCSFSVS